MWIVFIQHNSSFCSGVPLINYNAMSYFSFLCLYILIWTKLFYDRRVFIGLGFIILSLTASYIIILFLKKSPEQAQQPVQNPIFNNMTHNPANPALISFFQILFGSIIASLVIIPFMFVTNKGPNGFILGNLPLLLLGTLVIPSLFYAFNVNLRRFVIKEIKDGLGLDYNIVQPQNSSIWSTNVQIET